MLVWFFAVAARSRDRRPKRDKPTHEATDILHRSVREHGDRPRDNLAAAQSSLHVVRTLSNMGYYLMYFNLSSLRPS